MHILLTNDDGYAAPGLAALADVALELGDVTIVAPASHMSGCSHSATTDRPLELVEHAPRFLSVSGTPVDCVRLALLELVPDVSLVLSGINDGANLGIDVLMSGTVAAAREAQLLGRPAIALSQYRRRNSRPDWPQSTQFATRALAQVLERMNSRVELWNVNLPDLAVRQDTEIVQCPVDREPLAIRFQASGSRWNYVSDYHQRPRQAGTDVAVCFAGKITISQLTQRDLVAGV
jgi:5'-nucleotidase